MTNPLKHSAKTASKTSSKSSGKTPGKSPARASAESSFQELRTVVLSALEDFKAIDIQEIDVSAQNSLTDLFVLASGNSSRHVQSMAENLVMKAKAAGCQPLGIEGEKEGEWVLVDLNDIIVHLMQPKTRAFYNLEKLWEAGSNRRSTAATPS